MTVTFDIKEIEKRIHLSIENYSKNLATIKTRVSGDFLDSIKVEAYNDKKPINTLANITVKGQELIVQPWDNSLFSAVVKAIQTSDLNLNPITDGKVIRVPVPTLSEERRKDLAKAVDHKSEQAKVAVRNIRRDELDNLKKQEKNKAISEDEHKRMSKDIEKIVEKAITEIDNLTKKKVQELLTY